MRPLHVTTGMILVGLLAATEARAADDELSLDLGEKTALVIRKIPKGSFLQGSPAGEPGRDPDETQRRVTISKPFWLGRTPVTRAQFALFVSETRYATDAEKAQIGGTAFTDDTKKEEKKPKGAAKDFSWRNPGFVQHDDDPVVGVTFGDATAFVAWVARKTSRRVRLPTEAEWEYAARAGTTTPWFAATTETEANALGWFKASAAGSTHPVATRRSNAFGLFDMAGNVQQWVRDIYAPYPAGDVVDPDVVLGAGEPEKTEKHVLRGGSWSKEARRGRSAARSKSPPGARSADNGFRIAVDDEPLPGAAMLPAAPADADAGAVVAAPPPRSEGGGSWSLLFAPLLAAGASVGWVLARRRSRPAAESAPPPRILGTTLKMPRTETSLPVSLVRVTDPPPPPVPLASAPPPPAPNVTQRLAPAPTPIPAPVPTPVPVPATPSEPADDAIPLSLPASDILGPQPPTPPPPAPFPLAASMLPPSSGSIVPPASSGLLAPPPPSSFTGPPSSPLSSQSPLPPPTSSQSPAPASVSSQRMTGPPAPSSQRLPPSSVGSMPAVPPHQPLMTGPPAPSAGLQTLLAALSSRPLLPPAVVDPEPEPHIPEPDVTAPYPAISSSSVVLDPPSSVIVDPDVTAPLPAIKDDAAPPSAEGPPSPPPAKS